MHDMELQPLQNPEWLPSYDRTSIVTSVVVPNRMVYLSTSCFTSIDPNTVTVVSVVIGPVAGLAYFEPGEFPVAATGVL